MVPGLKVAQVVGKRGPVAEDGGVPDHVSFDGREVLMSSDGAEHGPCAQATLH